MKGNKIPQPLSWLLTWIVWVVIREPGFCECAARLRRVSHGSWGIRSTSHTTLLSLGGNRKGRYLCTRHETYLLERSNILKLVHAVHLLMIRDEYLLLKDRPHWNSYVFFPACDLNQNSFLKQWTRSHTRNVSVTGSAVNTQSGIGPATHHFLSFITELLYF